MGRFRDPRSNTTYVAFLGNRARKESDPWDGSEYRVRAVCRRHDPMWKGPAYSATAVLKRNPTWSFFRVCESVDDLAIIDAARHIARAHGGEA